MVLTLCEAPERSVARDDVLLAGSASARFLLAWLDALVDALARRLASGPPLAFAATRKAVNAATLTGLHDALERERLGQAALLGTDDAAEGMRAFNEKRRPRSRGRRPGQAISTPAAASSVSVLAVDSAATPAQRRVSSRTRKPLLRASSAVCRTQ